MRRWGAFENKNTQKQRKRPRANSYASCSIVSHEHKLIARQKQLSRRGGNLSYAQGRRSKHYIQNVPTLSGLDRLFSALDSTDTHHSCMPRNIFWPSLQGVGWIQELRSQGMRAVGSGRLCSVMIDSFRACEHPCLHTTSSEGGVSSHSRAELAWRR